MAAPYISVVVPTLNEEGNIGRLIDGLKEVLSQYKYEIIVVDSHSSDRTVEIAKGRGAKILYSPKGKGLALMNGLKAARGQIQIAMDADLSHAPIESKLLIAGIETGYDVCMGSRFIIGGGSYE